MLAEKNDETVVMVFKSETETWEQEIMTIGEFEERKEIGDVMTLDQFERMVSRLPGVEERTWEEAEKYGFEETAMSMNDARTAAADSEVN